MARLLVQEGMDHLDVGPDTTVLDPSCGSGRFLVAALRALRDRLGVEAGAILPRIHGVELDPYAAALARLALLREAGMPAQQAGEGQVVTGDALLLRWQKRPDQLKLAFGQDSPLPPGDLIVGNPPYGASMSGKAIALYKEHYELARGRFDIVSLFVELAGVLLAPGGVLAYVLPHAFARSGGYAATREWLLAHGALAALVNIGRGFPGIDLNTCALVWREGARDGKTRGYEARGDRFCPVGEADAGFYAGRRAWPIYVGKTNLRLAQQMEADGARPLDSLAKITRGATIKGLAKLTKDADHWDGIPVVRGRNIKPYADLAEQPLGRLPEDALPPNASKAILAERTVVFQNIGDRIKATLCPKGMLPIDTVNVLACEDPAWACYLVAYLNSRLVVRYVRDMILNRATLTVHFDAPTIGALPVRLPDATELDYYDRNVPMLIGEPDPDVMQEVEERILALYGVEEVMADV